MATEVAPMLKAPDAARRLGVNVNTLYAHLRKNGGQIGGIQVAVQINYTWRFSPEAIERVLRGESETA